MFESQPRVEPEIKEGAKILFVGQNPGAEEVRSGIPFCPEGRSGAMLRQYLTELDKQGIVYSITNAVNYYTAGNRKPTAEEIEYCVPELLEIIDEQKSLELIVAIGDIALKALTGETGITRLNGKFLKDYPIPILACVHPSYILHGKPQSIFEKGILPAIKFFEKEHKIDYEVVETLKPNKQLVAMDIEDTGDIDTPNTGRLRSFAICQKEDTKVVWTSKDDKLDRESTVDFLEFFNNTPMVCHTAQHEFAWLLSRGLNPNIIEDTKLLAYLIDERMPLDLESLCLRYGVDKAYKPDSRTSLRGEEHEHYNAKDAYNTYKLYHILKPLVPKEALNVYKQILIPSTKALAQVELNGVYIDTVELKRVQEEAEKRIKALKLHSDPIIKDFDKNSDKPFNINSPIHKAIVVFDMLNYAPLLYTDNEDNPKPSTRKDVLERLLLRKENKTLRKLYELTQIEGGKKFFKRIIDNLVTYQDQTFVYPSFWVGNTTTGRIISNNPNFQNVPKAGWLRTMVKSRFPQGWLVEWDYKAIELRLIAGLSGDPVLIEAFTSGDPHEETAKAMYAKKIVTKEERDKGKKLNYCVAIETPVLKDDLTWVPAGELAPGDRLIAFDENQGTGYGRKACRKWKEAIVVANGIKKLHCNKIYLSNGETIIATKQHRWVTTDKRGKNKSKWKQTKNLQVGDILLKYLTPWTKNKTYEAGWLAGFFDGEGWTSVSGVAASQKLGDSYTRCKELCKQLGYKIAEYDCGSSPCWQVAILGGVEERMRFLGEIRPCRLIKNFVTSLIQKDRPIFSAISYPHVIKIEDIGLYPVAILETSSKTYIAGGYAAHNTIAYGAGANKIAYEMGVEVEEARLWLKRFWSKYHVLKDYFASIPQEGIVYSPTGMHRTCSSWTEAKNYPIQNSALIAFLTSFNILVPELQNRGSVVVAPIHDSNLADIPTKEEALKIAKLGKEIMESVKLDFMPPELPLLVDCKIGKNWGEMHDLEEL